MDSTEILRLGSFYGTDKFEHGYLPFYADTLPENPRRILEIGVKEGASMRMWQALFPLTELHGLDLFEEFSPPYDVKNAIFHKGDQRDFRKLEELRALDFDVIIDDGSHNSRDQMTTFFGLFNGKHYYIEDTHCCVEAFYRQGLPFNMTALQLFKQNPIACLSKNIILLQDAHVSHTPY